MGNLANFLILCINAKWLGKIYRNIRILKSSKDGKVHKIPSIIEGLKHTHQGFGGFGTFVGVFKDSLFNDFHYGKTNGGHNRNH